jgi:hypothetical protein
LFVDFAKSMLLEAMTHAPASGRTDRIAMLNAVYLLRSLSEMFFLASTGGRRKG